MREHRNDHQKTATSICEGCSTAEQWATIFTQTTEWRFSRRSSAGRARDQGGRDITGTDVYMSSARPPGVPSHEGIYGNIPFQSRDCTTVDSSGKHGGQTGGKRSWGVLRGAERFFNT